MPFERRFRSLAAAAACALAASTAGAQSLPPRESAPGWALRLCEAAEPIEQKAYAERMADASAQGARDLAPIAVARLRQSAPELFELPGWPGAVEDFYRQRAESWERYSPSLLQAARDKALLPQPGLFERIALNQCLRSPFVEATRRRVEEANAALDESRPVSPAR
jgi:hypothetical protein